MSSEKLIALVDCNNFFVSCERVFDPSLRFRPVAVLSSNDGCIIARSQEVKALGIPMGAPYFQYRDYLEANRVIIRSSNFPLYGDMSARVMSILSQFAETIEIYSIDEAFLEIDEKSMAKIRSTVLQWTGIPISIGLSSTKTLAKAANRIAKKRADGVMALITPSTIQKALAETPVEDIWGIGSQTTSWLHKQGIQTALELTRVDETWLRKHKTVVMQRLVMELRGISCLTLDEIAEPKKSILCSRSFGRPVTELAELQEAIASYVANAAEKARAQKSVALSLTVFAMQTQQEGHYPAQSVHIPLTPPTAYTPTLIARAKQAIAHLYQPGAVYKKVGVQLDGLVADNPIQQDLFNPPTDPAKENRVMALVDRLNSIYGEKTIHTAAEGLSKGWSMKRNNCSPRYTTQWDEIPIIR